MTSPFPRRHVILEFCRVMISRAIPLQDLAQRITQQQLELEKLRQEYEARQTQLCQCLLHPIDWAGTVSITCLSADFAVSTNGPPATAIGSGGRRSVCGSSGTGRCARSRSVDS